MSREHTIKPKRPREPMRESNQSSQWGGENQDRRATNQAKQRERTKVPEQPIKPLPAREPNQ
jgi:hypothetical protein